jgi:hypothetical protein
VWDIIEAMRSSFLRQRGGGIREGTVCPCFPKFLACTIFFFFFFFCFWGGRRTDRLILIGLGLEHGVLRY